MKCLKKSSGWGNVSLLWDRLWPETACVIPGLCCPGMHCKVSKDVPGDLWRLVLQFLSLCPCLLLPSCHMHWWADLFLHKPFLASLEHVHMSKCNLRNSLFLLDSVRESLKEHLEFIYSNPLLKQGRLEQAAQDHFQLGFEYHQGWRFCHFSGQPLWVFDHPQATLRKKQKVCQGWR